MHDALPVRMIERVGHLREQRARRLHIHHALALEPRGQRLAAHIAHHEPAQPAPLTEGVQRYDAYMLQAGDGLRFAAESLQHTGVASGAGGQHLDRHQPLQRLIAGQIHGSHATTSDQADDLVVLAHGLHEGIAQRVGRHVVGTRRCC